MSVRTGSAAKKAALAHVGHDMPKAGYCLQFTRGIFNIAVKYPSAISAWNNAKKKHTSRPPSGAVVPVFFHSASQYRHVCVAIGDGRVVTTNGAHVVIYSSIDALANAWGAPYMGWSEDLNGVTVYTPPPAKPTYKNVTALQKAIGAKQDNVWGPDSTKRLNAVRSASLLGGGRFPYGVKYAQRVVGTKDDGHWGPNSGKAHDSTVKAIQRAVGVTPDGSYGPKTDAAVKALVKGAHKG